MYLLNYLLMRNEDLLNVKSIVFYEKYIEDNLKIKILNNCIKTISKLFHEITQIKNRSDKKNGLFNKTFIVFSKLYMIFVIFLGIITNYYIYVYVR
jgi:hypothetical protein